MCAVQAASCLESDPERAGDECKGLEPGQRPWYKQPLNVSTRQGARAGFKELARGRIFLSLRGMRPGTSMVWCCGEPSPPAQ